MPELARKSGAGARKKSAARMPKVDKRARFSEEVKARAVALAREGKVTREIGTELGLDKSQWQNIRLWTEKANVSLPRERVRGATKSTPSRPAKARAVRSAPLAQSADPIARILELIENPGEAIARLEGERAKVSQRLNQIDKLLAVLRSGS